MTNIDYREILVTASLNEIDEWDKLNECFTRHFTVTHFNYSEMIRKQAAKLRDSLDNMD